jgi:bacterioferritin
MEVYMENVSVNKLNHMLKGEEMAVLAYENLIQGTKDTIIKNELQNIQRNHKEHSARLAEHIQDLGGKPHYGTGASGVMADVKMSLENLQLKDDVYILKEAYDGEDQGIAMIEELSGANIGKDSSKLINEILSNDHDHLKKMAKMIGEYEENH